MPFYYEDMLIAINFASVQWKNKTNIMVKEVKEDFLKSLFQGASIKDVQINIIMEKGAHIVYKQVADTKADNGLATDEQVANAIRAINGKDKPLNQYQLWVGVCCMLSWKYGFPRNLDECCRRINSLDLGLLEFECKYENLRKLTGIHPFINEDARMWDSYHPKERERKLFNECYSVAQAFEAEMQKQLEAE